jgi:hypothetical protein
MPEGTIGNSIVLIPKIDNPSDLKDYHPIGLPIGLCNVLYKVASKCLVNRMRPFFLDRRHDVPDFKLINSTH